MYTGMRDVISKTYTNEGFRAFYKGLTPTLLRQYPASGVFFYTYEKVLNILTKVE
jgi:hypothetical protein